jgi:hypothetical protein
MDSISDRDLTPVDSSRASGAPDAIRNMGNQVESKDPAIRSHNDEGDKIIDQKFNASRSELASDVARGFEAHLEKHQMNDTAAGQAHDMYDNFKEFMSETADQIGVESVSAIEAGKAAFNEIWNNGGSVSDAVEAASNRMYDVQMEMAQHTYDTNYKQAVDAGLPSDYAEYYAEARRYGALESGVMGAFDSNGNWLSEDDWLQQTNGKFSNIREEHRELMRDEKLDGHELQRMAKTLDHYQEEQMKK